jgi:predicted DNA-binding transcriptional regulator YafY
VRWALSQGDLITVFAPLDFIEIVKDKIEKMKNIYN